MNRSLTLSVLFALLLSPAIAFAHRIPRVADVKPSAILPTTTSEDPSAAVASEFPIPGPLRSFLRMAGISQKVRPEEVLPLLGRNVFTEGYEGSHLTEFLVLLRRYVVQARELSTLASQEGMVLRVSNCDDAKPLLRILGYRIKGECGHPDASLQTEDPERAFLSIDSGFPIPDLEQALQSGKAFEYPYPSTPVPVIFAESDWTKASKKNYVELSKDLLDTLLNDPAMAQLYWALSRLDSETSQLLTQTIGIPKLLPYAAVLDFYGQEFVVDSGKIKVPGGTAAEAAWKDLVGESPSSPAVFIQKLLAKDNGWMAAYFDVLSRAGRSQQEYFTDPRRLRFLYNGVRWADESGSSTHAAFRPAPGMLLLATRLQFDDSGQPLIPGDLKVWHQILHQRHNAACIRRWMRQNGKLNRPEDLLQALMALSRYPSDTTPLQLYMTLTEIDSRRPVGHRLSPETVTLLARKFNDFGDQYRMFAEFPELSDDSISLFFDVTRALDNVPTSFRGNACGIFQANLGLWQILARQGQISASHLNDSWKRVIQPFSGVRSADQLYDAGKTSLTEIFRFAGKPRASQDEIIELLAGPPQTTPEGMLMHREVANRIRSVLDDQRLVSLDTILAVGDGLLAKSRGSRPEEYVVLLAAQTQEFEMPRPIFTSGERTEWAAGIYNNHHTDAEMRSNLPRLLKAPTVSRSEIDDARGELASFLRDTLVGLNYAYYEPPGAQALHNNPLLVRSHDFLGETVGGIPSFWQQPEILGEGSPAGGGAHFVGSLADLPFALGEMEQDFNSPESVQALILEEMTPQLFTNAVVPRWWNVSPLELHAVALYQRAGEELLAASSNDEALRDKVISLLSARVLPRKMRQISNALRNGHVSDVIPNMMPADTFYLAAEYLGANPQQNAPFGTATQELQEILRQHPDEVNWNRLSHDFGTPHPSILQTYSSELLNVGPMPAFSGVSSRFLAESCDSPNLYWARLVDEARLSPVMLNHLAPVFTRMMVEKIFATDFEDWPALLRAMHEVGAEFQQGKVTLPASVSAIGVK